MHLTAAQQHPCIVCNLFLQGSEPKQYSITQRTQPSPQACCRGSATSAGLIVRSWNAEEGDAAVLFDWEKNRLEVRFSSGDNALDLSAPVTEDSVQRSVGGHCQLREGEHVQVLLGRALVLGPGLGLGLELELGVGAYIR